MSIKQELFTKIATHLLQQNEKSRLADGICAYRGENGTMCAIGCIISDEHYTIKLEGTSVVDHEGAWKAVKRSNPAIENLDLHDRHNVHVMLSNLQNIHDLQPIEDWRKHLLWIANENYLEMPASPL